MAMSRTYCLIAGASRQISRAFSSSKSDVDVAIVGAGHNGLVAALLLARQGLTVSSTNV
jgi:ribulose 1,5-bisphosphate synthetase/thiazole synthase